MKPKLTLYSRKDCRLCDEMKAIVSGISAQIPVDVEEIDIDTSAELRERYGHEVPVLFIDGRKAFKYRTTAKQLQRKLKSRLPPMLARLVRVIGKETS
jgi:glutaredoxin